MTLRLMDMAADAEEDEVAESEGPVPDRGYILPHEIATDEKYNLRRYDPGDEEELKAVELLAQSLDRDGQLDDIVLVPEDDRLVLLIGHRRRRAVTLINERRAIDHRPLLRLRYSVNREPGDPLRKALASNVQRKDFSPMELALNIQRIRTENRWEGFKGAKKVAEYLFVSPSTVTQHEKFLSPECDDETRRKLHHGIISAQSAFDMLQVKPPKRMETYERAMEIQKDHDIEKAIADHKSGKVTAEEAASELHKKKHIDNPAIKQAIRETPGASEMPQPMSRKEIVEFMLQFDAPAYGFINGPIRQFIRALDRLFSGTAGNQGERTVVARFDAMVRGVSRGKPEDGSRVKAPAKPKSGKLPRRDRGVPKASVRDFQKKKAAAAAVGGRR